MKVEVVDTHSPHLPTIKALGRANASTLGFLPEGAFDQYAFERTIIAAIDSDGKCVGYLLYRVTKGQVAIAHLCIEEPQRRKGIARALVEYLKEQTKETCHGITLRCRRDYIASKSTPPQAVGL